MKRRISWWAFYTATICVLLACVRMMSQTVTTMAENQRPEREICVIIDPGHGGEDGGAVSVSGKAESEYNLEIAVRLRDVLHFLGYGTKMTRNTDISIYTEGKTLAQKKMSDLKERVRIINGTENAILLSIHQNSFPEERYCGPQVFFPRTEGSEQLAKQLQHVLTGGLSPGSNRKAKESRGVYLMEHIRCPGVLIECGFLTNYAEEAALRDPEYQKKVSFLIALGVSQYLSNT